MPASMIAAWLLLAAATSSLAMPTDQSTDSPANSDKIQCYACTSYVPSCKAAVNASSGSVPHVTCKTSCFVRQGYEKDLPLYRGCADDYNSVSLLDTSYIGCRKQLWNGVERMWCFCDSDMCNGDSMEQLAGPHARQGEHHLPRETEDAEQDSKPDEEVQYNPEHFPNQGDYDMGDGHDFRYDQYGKEAGMEQVDDTHAPYQELRPPGDQYQGSEELRTDTGVDRPYLRNHNKVYTDIEQDQFGSDQSHDNDNNNQEHLTRQDALLGGPLPLPENYYTYPERNQASYFGHNKPSFPFEGAAPRDYKDNRQYGLYERRRGIYERQTTAVPATVVAESYRRYEHANGPVFNYHYETVSPGNHVMTTQPPMLHITPTPDKIICSHTGFIPNPEDCSTFLACIMDSHIGQPVMHRMRCPGGLFWDNTLRVCVASSSTCRKRNPQQASIPYGEHSRESLHGQYHDGHSH